MDKLPEGVTCQVTVWIKSDSLQITTAASSDEMPNELKGQALKDWVKKTRKSAIRNLNNHHGVKDFRAMTHAEIAAVTTGTHH